MNEQKVAKLDAALIEAAKGVRVLKALAWPSGSEARFLRAWRSGKAVLPECLPQPRDLSQSVLALKAIAGQCSIDDPVEKFLYETAHSYA